MDQTVTALANLSILTFVLSSMAALGLSLTLPQITRALTPARPVLLALVANFVAAPLLALAVARLLGLGDDLTMGLLLLGTAAGAPFLPKLAQVAHGDVAFSVGLMVLLMVASVGYVPFVLVTLTGGADVAIWDIARPLLQFMLLPLAIALGVRARYPDAARLAPPLNQVATTALGLGLVLGLVVVLPTLVDAFGTGAFAAAFLFTVCCVAAGWLLGGDPARRVTTALGTGQRNISAALLVAGTTFLDQPVVLVMVMVGGVMSLAVLLPLAGELGRRAS